MKSFVVNEHVKFKDQWGSWKYGTINSFNWESDHYWVTVTDADGLYMGMELIARDDLFECSPAERQCGCGANSVGSTKHSWYCPVKSK